MRALTSASNLRQRQLCPGSARLEADLPDIATVESMQGDRLHDYSAHLEYVREFLSPEEQDLLRLADQLEAQAFDAIGLRGVYSEKRECELGNQLVSGHPDLMRIYGVSEEVTIIIDRKFGWFPVERADVNLQMRVYAVLAPSPEVYVSILQPRSSHADRITIAKYDIDAKSAARNQIAAIIEACENPDAPLVAGEEQCRYCRARAICPALREAVTKELVVFDDPSDLSKPARLARVEARLAQASDEQLGALFNACALARLVNDPLGDEIRRRIEAGKMDDYMLGKEMDVRKIADARRAAALLVLRGLLTRQEILDICRLDIGRVEEKYRKESKATAKEAKAEVNRALESVIEIETRKARILRK